MTDFLSFLPILTESVDTIRARMDADANAGLVAADPGYLDTVEGGFYWDLTQPAALEADRLWDFAANEVIAASYVSFAWGDYLDAHGEVLGVARKDQTKAAGLVTYTGVDGTVIPAGNRVASPATTTDDVPTVFATDAAVTIAAGVATVAVTAVDFGSQGNAATGTVNVPVDSVDGVASVANAAPMSGGADVESDLAYRDRLLLEYRSPAGGGTAADYERWALAYPGVGFATVEPLWAGAGTVRVVIADAAHNPAPGSVVSGLQAQLDPTPGLGHGLAPIGAIVTIATVSGVAVSVSAVVTFAPGYSLDGAGGTVATRASIKAAIMGYVNGLAPGEDVVLAHTESRFFRVVGVYDVSGVLLNGSAANVSIGATQVAQTDAASITLT